MSRWRPTLPATAGFLAYLVLASVVGEVWPLSRYPMYAHQTAEGAIPLMLVDGEPAPPEDFEAFHGCGPGDVRIPRGTPSRMGWRMDEVQRWLASHRGEGPGDVRVRFGHATLAITLEGPRLADDFVLLCEGTARRRE